MRFPGQIRLPDIDHPAIPATFVVDDAHAEIFLDEESLGRWSLYDVHARRLVSSAFEVDLGDEEIVFLAEDPIDFAYRGVEHMAQAWARFKAKRLPGRMISVSMSRRDTAPSRIAELRGLMEDNLDAAEVETPPPAEIQPVAAPVARSASPAPQSGEATVTSGDTGPLAEPARSPDVEQLERQRQELEAAREKLEEERRRLEQARLETVRREEEQKKALAEEMEALEQKRHDAERLLELERAESARLEKAAEEAARLEEERRRLEEARAEAERAEEERREELRAETERLEAERQEALREEEERQEHIRVETERLEAERQEALREEEERQEQIRAEEERLQALREETETRLRDQEVTVEIADITEPAAEEPPVIRPEPGAEPAGAEAPDDWDLDSPPEPATTDPRPEPVLAGATRERSGLMGAVKSAFVRGGRAHEHVFVEAAGGLGIVRYVCEECGHVSISVND